MNLAKWFTVDVNLVVCLAASWLIELALGSPRFLPKFSDIAGRFVKASADKALVMTGRTQNHRARAEKRAGVFLLIYIILFAAIATAVLLDFIKKLHPFLYYIFNVIILCRVINTRGAADIAAEARHKLRAEDTASIKRIVAGISKNCLDGIFAPMLYATLGVFIGIPTVFAIAYKSLAIMDEAIGHKSGEYNNLGWAAAKMDDAANYLPARLCGLILPLLAPFCGTGARGIARGFRATSESNAARVFSNNYTSPNDAWPAAAFAGTLGISIGSGDDIKILHKQETQLREPELKDIGKAIRLMFVSSAALLALCCGALLYFSK